MEHGSQNTNNSGCFSGFLRMILCRNGASTKPSDYTPKLKPNLDVPLDNFADIKDPTKLDHTKVGTDTHKPGIVARLMGLESLPDSKFSPALMVKSPDSVFRSRSVNFMDYLLEMDLKAGEGHRIRHRRVKTSVSFREVPGLHQQQQDMLVLYLEKNTAPTQQIETVPKPAKKKDRSVRKERRVVNLADNEPGRVHCRNNCGSRGSGESVLQQGEHKIKKKQVKVMEEKEIMSELKFTVKKMKMKKKKIERVHKQFSETSSPVSVLDRKHLTLRAQKDLVQANRKRGVIPSAKKKKGLVQMEWSDQAPSTVDHQLGIEYCLKMLGKVCSLLEHDIETSSNRMTVIEDFEEICLKIERAIMDHMIQEAVDDLHLC